MAKKQWHKQPNQNKMTTFVNYEVSLQRPHQIE